MNPFDIAAYLNIGALLIDGGGSVALVAIAWYARELRKDFKNAQIVSELKHDNIAGRVGRVESMVFNKRESDHAGN